MRTRFLNIDYFNSAPIDEFLRLPLPPLSTSTSTSTSEEDYLFHCIDEDDASVLGSALQNNTLPIDRALSKFFSDVLPHSIHVDQCCSPEFSSDKKNDEILYQEVELESQRSLGSETLEEVTGTTINGKDDNLFEILQFEVPEPDLSLENVCITQIEELQIFSEVSDAETSEDVCNPMLRMQNLGKIEKSIFAVENISMEYHVYQKVDLLEEGGSINGQLCPYYSEFPLLEVDVLSLGIFSSISVVNEIQLLESIEPQLWREKDETMIDGKELLQFMEFDMSEYLSVHSLSNQCLEPEIACSNFVQEMDLFSVIEHSCVIENMSLYQGRPDDNSIWSMNSIVFEEFQFLDKDLSQIYELFSNLATVHETETCQQMFCEALKFRNFNELIVIHELTLVDYTFKSLPVPIFSHHEKIKSLPEYIEETLAELKPQPSFSSDAIYLDWHILEEDNCNNGKYSSCLKALEELDVCVIDSSLNSVDCGMLIFDLIFSENCPNILNTKENKEMLNVPSGDISVAHLRFKETSSRVLNDGSQKMVKGFNINSEKVSPLVESISQFDDLDFFLNPLETAVKKSHKEANSVDTNTTFPEGLSSDSVAACAISVAQLQQWNIKLHQITLSDDILALIDDLQKNYLAILENDTELRKTKYSYLAADDFTLLTLPRQKLMDCIKETSAKRHSLAYHDDNMMAFITLYAIKQMAWYLCYYGIHTTYLYINKLYQSLQCLKFRLRSLWTLMLDALEKANKEMTKSHPSLSVIHGILQSNFRRSRLKILIVAERVFWLPLKSLLTSMEISCINPQFSQTHTSRLDVCYDYECTDTVMDAVLHSDCCLVSLEYISASFPFEKFGIILEYGGSYGSSRLCTISPKIVGFPVLHFLKVDLEDLSVSKALCESVHTPTYGEVEMGEDPHFVPVLSESYQKLEELLNFMPVEEYNSGSLEDADIVKPCTIHLSVPCMPLDRDSTQICTSMSSFPGAIIIVNTQSVDGEMIISRRSTYQRILAMEKEGTQVVERDLNMPVDVIVSAAVCLMWYDCRNIGKKATAPNEASSSLPLCVENIAANVLTSLSFTFCGCILIFEGESNFLAGVMESSDELYAAAASLGMDLQLFCSYSFEMTDEIILSCIGHATKSSRGIYPRMPESETLVESFLTAFPSINPLSSHAILSSTDVFIKFLEWSHEHRVRAVQKYHIPDESVALLSAFCRYGEREDCKSGTTDCSSVSSAPDSVNGLTKSVSEMRKRKYTGSVLNVDKHMDDVFHFEPLKLFIEGSETPTKMSKPCNPWLSEGPDIFEETGNSNLSFEDKLFTRKLGSKINMKTTPSSVSKPCDFQMSKGHMMSEEIENQPALGNNALFSQNQRLDTATMIKFDGSNNINLGNLQKDFIGEVFNIDDSYPSVEHSSIANSLDFSHLLAEMERDPAARYSRSAKKLSFGNSSLTTFPTAAEISCDSDALNRQNSGEQIFQHSDKGLNKKGVLLEQKDLSQEDTLPKAVRNSHSFVEKDIPHYGDTPLSNAIRFSQPHQGSPWTIEFLNRIREKSRLRQKSLPQDLSVPCFGYSGNISKAIKRKSPSILDFYKYQRGSTPNRMMEQKKQKHSLQLSCSSKNEKTLPPFIPAATPIDKRARQTLSFATSGNRGQSKLVWGDKNARILRRQFKHCE